MRRWLRIVAVLGVLGGIAGGVALADFLRFLHGPMNLPRDDVQVFEVERGMSVHRMSSRLAEQGWIDRPFYLRLAARMRDDAGRIHTGEYRLEPGITPHGLLDKLAAGDVILYRLTVIEGWTFRQMFAAIQQHEAVTPILAEADEAEIMDRLGLEAESPEGWFYPDTYTFRRGATDLDLLRQSHRRMRQVLEEEWAARSEDAPVNTPYEALVLASIIERETGVPSERARVAGVFAERLDIGMRLQTDPTVIYGLGDDFDGRLRYRHLRTDTPYNTYTRAGLTPTPIALPARPAIHAALNPDRRGEFYFVATGDGGHVFSKTLREHNEAVIKYQLDGDASRLRGGQ